MAKLLIIFTIMIMSITLTSSANLYTVGDSSGWDISTDLDSWTKDKRFLVGDVLLFQYSSYHSVEEVTKEDYKGCNATNVPQSGGNGNTSFALSRPGERYFVCGNRLHCLGGMKLHVRVEENGGAAASPATAPQAHQPGGSFPPHSSKSNNPSALVPGSASYNSHAGLGCLLVIWLSFPMIAFPLT